MNYRILACLLATISLFPSPVLADFGGSTAARRAVSPNGDLIVRIVSERRSGDQKAKSPTRNIVRFYEYDRAADTYKKRSSFEVETGLGNLMYVSNEGDLIFIGLHEKNSVRLFSREGKLRKTWGTKSFLTAKQQRGCALTGSTLQWLEEAGFVEGRFHFRGPSHVVRALAPPFTLMRGADPDLSFSGAIDIKKSKLEMHETEP